MGAALASQRRHGGAEQVGWQGSGSTTGRDKRVGGAAGGRADLAQWERGERAPSTSWVH